MSRFRRWILLLLVGPLLPAAAVELPFIEEFDDNQAGWPWLGEGDTHIATFEEGRLVYENLSPEPNMLKWSFLPVDLGGTSDIEVSLVIQYIGGPDTVAYGLLWDMADEKSPAARRHFDVSGNGWYRIWGSDGQTSHTERDWRKSPVVRTDGPNTLTIQRIGRRVFYSLNGTPIEAFDQYRYGRAAGFTVTSGVTVAVDRLSVTPLAGDATARSKLLAQLEAAVQQHRIASGPAQEDVVERFDDNSRNWPYLREGENWTASIADGAMTWQNRASNTQITSISLPINGYANYELSVRLRHLAGTDSRAVGLAWGASADANAGGFVIAADGHYSYTYRANKETQVVIPWTRTKAVKVRGENELKVRKLQDTYFLFINGQLLADLPARETHGTDLRLEIPPGATVSFDELRLSYLHLPEAQVTREIKQHVAKLEKEHGKNGLRSAVVVAKIAEENRLRAEGVIRDHPSDADYKQLARMRKRFTAKKALSVLGSLGRPADITGVETSKRFYYNYKLIGRTQFYYEFQVQHVGSTQDIHGNPLPIKMEDFAVINVQLADRKW